MIRMSLRRIIVSALCVVLSFPVWADSTWNSHFAYNNVEQIAMTPDKVFAISDGNMFSVDKSNGYNQWKIQKYDRQSGLHGSNITCIGYDEESQIMIIAYASGKLDLWTSQGVRYIPDLYNKDMLQDKTIYNVTFKGHTAYFATHYGIQTFDMRNKELIDSYWPRPDGEVTPIRDVLFLGDSIYAFSIDPKNTSKIDSLFSASLHDNLADYHFWHREKYSNRITPDPDKGKHYKDSYGDWYAGETEGVILKSEAIPDTTFLPDGPLVNTPYRMQASGTKLGVVQGGYTINFFKRPGIVMTFNNGKWQNYDNAYMNTHLNLKKSEDYSDIAFDPKDPSHFFVSSFGYGLFEFRNDTFYCHHTTTNSALEPCVPGVLYPYVWVDGLRFDNQGNLWMLNNSDAGVKVLKADGTWVAISNAACKNLDRSKDLLISVRNPNIKIISSIRNGIGIFDDNGTIDDPSDDRAMLCSVFTDEVGNIRLLDRISSMYQTSFGILLIGTETGLFRIDTPEELLNGNYLCHPVTVSLPQEGRDNIFGDTNIRSITEDSNSRIWIGTQASGLYCLSSDLIEIQEHISIDNSPIPSNDILSLCYMQANNHLFIGTADGLVEYDLEGHSGDVVTGNPESETANNEDFGNVGQWRLHFSYTDPTEIAASASNIYAVANNALYFIDRKDKHLEYLSKATGLNGSSVAHIAYDKATSQLIIAYDDGRLDLLDEDGNVRQMPELFMKASSIPTTINSIATGANCAYLSMPFGIVQINTKKAEISDTYYIGENASDVEVKFVVETNDSLYAFSEGSLYSASLEDNLVDYSFWHRTALPNGKLLNAMLFNNELHILLGKNLYRRQAGKWKKAMNNQLKWVHSCDDKLLAYIADDGLYRVTEDYQLEGVTENYKKYVANDAIYSLGEYWLAEDEKGLVHLTNNGDVSYMPEGPNSNFGYFLRAAHDRIYSTIGGRWAAKFLRYAQINIYDGHEWTRLSSGQLGLFEEGTWRAAIDPVSIAVDPTDADHFYYATYGGGVFEYNHGTIKHYSDGVNGSTLCVALPGIDKNLYTFTDGAITDAEGNLWVLNVTSIGAPVHVMTPNHHWYALQERVSGQNLVLTTPTGIWIDKRNSQRKWFMDQRYSPGVILMDDGGTPTTAGDDRCVKRSTFIDQNGNAITPSYFYSFAQDHTDRIWIGTEKGIITIPSTVDFFTSNACRRIIIPRNDGTGLGDYLLGDEQINCMAIDGGNRMWIGTQYSGLYLIEDDTITVAHFTEDNSLLPSNTIQSIAIMPTTGEVFVGTDKGIASYMSDASEPKNDMKNAYAFPNPVRPEYGGLITITGLMDNTTVNIVDAGGNLVCKTRSNGGTAVWDGKLPDGRQATAGVYTALCNADGGRAVVKILVIR